MRIEKKVNKTYMRHLINTNNIISYGYLNNKRYDKKSIPYSSKNF